MRKIWGAAALAALALTVSACASSGSSSTTSGSTPAAAGSSPATSAAASSPAASGGATLDARTIGGQQVLTNSAGMTLYWFAPDTSTTLKCTGFLCHLLAAGQGPGHRRVRRHRHAEHHHQVRRHQAGDLRRAPALHLRRRHRPRAEQGQRAQRLGRAVVRDDGLGRHPRGGHGRLALGQQQRRIRLLISRSPSERVVSAAVHGLPNRQAVLVVGKD